MPQDAGHYRTKLTSAQGALIEVLEERYPNFARVHELHVTHSNYEPRHFGDAIVIFERQDIRLRLNRDRGQVFADFAKASAPETWVALSDVHKLAFGEFPNLDLELGSCMALLEANFAQYVIAVGQ